MAVSEAWIPVTFYSYVTKESVLKTERISLIKPLRFDDPTGTDLTDFIVTDADGLLPVEIPSTT